MAENKARRPECTGLSSSSSSVEKRSSLLMAAECRKADKFIYPMALCWRSRAGIAGEGGGGNKKRERIWSHLRVRTPLHRRPMLPTRTEINNDNHERMRSRSDWRRWFLRHSGTPAVHRTQGLQMHCGKSAAVRVIIEQMLCLRGGWRVSRDVLIFLFYISTSRRIHSLIYLASRHISQGIKLFYLPR